MDKRMYNALLQGATTPAAGEGSLLMTIVPFALIFIIFYFFLIRPQNKKQKERIQELEEENADLRSKIEWGIYNM